MSTSTIISLLAGNTAVALGLALVAWIAARAGRPALAHVAWLLVLVKLLTPPLWRVPVTTGGTPPPPPAEATEVRTMTSAETPAGAPAAAVLPDAPADDTFAPVDNVVGTPVASAVARAPVAYTVDWTGVALAAWAVGAGAVLTVTLIGVGRFRRLLRNASPADAALQDEVKSLATRIGVTRVPAALVVPAAVSPMLYFTGLRRPRLILPEGLLESMTAEQRAGVIAHELAHLRRGDHFVRLLELPATVLLWFHPLVWVARRGLREAEEQCCDAWALSVLPGAGAGRRTYAEALVSAMELIARGGRLPVGATGLGRVATLRRRLTMIVAQPPPKSLSLAGHTVALALLAAVVVAPVRGQEQRTVVAPAASPAQPAESGKPMMMVSPGESVQDAIDKAPAGSMIILGKGVHPERVTITKPLNLAGESWDTTTLGPDQAGPSFTQQQKDEFFRRLEAATDPQERAGIAMEMAALTQPPTISVKGAADVTIAGIRIRGPYTGQPGSVNTNETLVRFDSAARGVLDQCVVVGPFSNGVTIVNGSDVRITRSLIAAIWGTGVQVYAGERGDRTAKPAKVHLLDSDVRNCNHRCVTISGEGSIIERCRISGSAWHGIRYDHCSPTVKDNLIFGNARFGIYASGNTAATVTGNVLWRNEMAGLWCLFNNRDRVEGNTIVGNVREAVAISGGATTTFRKNVIANSPVGILLGKLSDTPDAVPEPRLESNLLWQNPRAFVMQEEAKPLPPGNETDVDPKFAAPEKGDFRLADDSPARKLGAGAAEPLATASPFPIQPGEQAMIPDGETRDHQKWKHNPPAQAAADAPQGEARLAAAQAGPATAKVEPSSVAATDKHRERQRQFAKMRVRQDQRRFSKDAVAEAEQLYQVANKNWRSEEARASLKTMIERFPEMNRTGCAVLYLGQWARGEEREQYLKRAAEKHGDCFYGNGVQVGAFARYLLGHYYKEQGKTAEAERLFDEIRKNYPDAITHRGDLLVAVLREEAKGTTKPSTATQPTE